jgi:hypothetical protein
MSMEEVIYRMTKDPAFAEAMLEDPAYALEISGLDLEPEELRGLQTAIHQLRVTSAATDDPTEWFAPQFNRAVADPTEWFEHQFQAETS